MNTHIHRDSQDIDRCIFHEYNEAPIVHNPVKRFADCLITTLGIFQNKDTIQFSRELEIKTDQAYLYHGGKSNSKKKPLRFGHAETTF